jgi:putative SOS response-associated peptidase YedK
MSNLYRLDVSAPQIAQVFEADAGKDPWAGGYIAPGKFAPVVIQGKEGRYLTPRLWGVPPPPKGDRAVTTVRNADSPFWIGTLRHTEFRCLVPVTQFQCWGGPDGARKRYAFSVPTEPVFAFAGIWRDSEVMSFAYLTTEPNTLIEPISPQSMPVILAQEDHEIWLCADWNVAKALVKPYPSPFMHMAVL